MNRLSIGVQSLDDSLLRLLGRRHTAHEAMEAYRLAHLSGFESVNLDLMYGLPRQTMAQWEDTLAKVLELGPPHLSLYCLTLEEGTPLERWVRQDKLPEPDPDLAADMYTLVRETLEGVGYHHYEISNWAMPGFQCLHNMAYWLNCHYLGVDPAPTRPFMDAASGTLTLPAYQRVQKWASQPCRNPRCWRASARGRCRANQPAAGDERDHSVCASWMVWVCAGLP